MRAAGSPSSSWFSLGEPAIVFFERGVGQPCRSPTRFPPIFDAKKHQLPDQIHTLKKPTPALPLLPFLAGAINRAEQSFADYVLHFCPFPPCPKSGPQSPSFQTFRPFLGEILCQISSLFSARPFDVYPP